jgi:hypothetical protein
MPDVMGVQTSGRSTARDRAHAVAMLKRAAKPPVDHPGCAAGADGLTVPFQPDFTGGITGQELPVGVRQQRTQMQRRGTLLDVDVEHHRGVLTVWAPRRLGVPAGLDQAHKRLHGARHRRHLITGVSTVVVVVFPVGDQRVAMRRQRGVELRRLVVGQSDPPAAGLLAGGLGDRGLRWGPRIGFGSRFQADRGAQLVDRRDPGQLRVMLIRARTRACGDHPDLIQ